MTDSMGFAPGGGAAAQTTLQATEAVVGKTPLPAVVVTIAPTVDTAAYTANDVVGGEQVLTGAVRVAGGLTRLDSLLVRDDGNQKVALTILIFDADPAGTYTDNAACPDLTADLGKLVGKINVAGADYETVGTVGIAHLKNIGAVMKSAATTNLWAVIVTTGTPDYVAGTDLSLAFGFTQF